MYCIEGLALIVVPKKILVLSWHMKAATMCEFSKQEFIGGLQFREIYDFAFGWAKEKVRSEIFGIGYWNRDVAVAF
ncbi:hypothetical protein CsSME_00053449 [Camellia sinensis var. sinensis]